MNGTSNTWWALSESKSLSLGGDEMEQFFLMNTINLKDA